MELSDKEFLVLNYLDIFRSIRDFKGVQKNTGLEPDEVMACLSQLSEKGYAFKEVKENLERWRITATGENAVKSYRQFMLDRTGQREAITKKFEEFENVHNAKFKQLATAWQVKIVEGKPVINDHSDPEYDAAILNQILEVHEKVLVTMEEIANALPMFKIYIERLKYAAQKVKENELDYLIKHENSYHNVWFELHENVLKFWGRERIE